MSLEGLAMKPGQQVGLKELYPCGSGKRYKSCCYRLDREKAQLRHATRGDNPPTIKERSVALIQCVREIMSITRHIDWGAIKENISADHVRAIYGVVSDLWPAETNLETLIPEPDDTQLRALYLGDVRPTDLVRNVFRFSLYSDHIYIIDPFQKPWAISDTYSPLNTPHQWVPDTLKLIHFLLLLEPWIKSDFVTLLPDPGEFDRCLLSDTVQLASDRLRRVPITDEDVDEFAPVREEEALRLLWSQPDEVLERKLRHAYPDISDEEVRSELAGAAHIRGRDALAIETRPYEGDGYLMISRSGANVDMSLYVSQLVGAFPYTASRRKWKELMSAKDKMTETARVWSPLTQAFQQLDFEFMDNVDTYFACNLRSEGRLAGLRTFLSDIWLELVGKSNGNFNSEVTRSFTDRLNYEHRKAQAEWDKIKQDWFTFIDKDTRNIMLTAFGTAFYNHVQPFLQGSLNLAIPVSGIGLAAIVKLLNDRCKRRSFRMSTPMSVFIDLSKHRPRT